MRRLVLAAALIAACVVPGVTALAHNGIGAAFKGQAGHYIVYAYDGELLPDGRLDYKLVLLNARSKNPVYGAHPAVNATRTGQPAATGAITTFGNVFFYNLPNPYPHDWDVHLRITGPLGTSKVTYRMHGAAPAGSSVPVIVTESPSSSSWPLILGIGCGVVVLALGALLAIRRSAARRRESPR
jgi:hypothetical protein